MALPVVSQSHTEKPKPGEFNVYRDSRFMPCKSLVPISKKQKDDIVRGYVGNILYSETGNKDLSNIVLGYLDPSISDEFPLVGGCAADLSKIYSPGLLSSRWYAGKRKGDRADEATVRIRRRVFSKEEREKIFKDKATFSHYFVDPSNPLDISQHLAIQSCEENKTQRWVEASDNPFPNKAPECFEVLTSEGSQFTQRQKDYIDRYKKEIDESNNESYLLVDKDDCYTVATASCELIQPYNYVGEGIFRQPSCSVEAPKTRKRPREEELQNDSVDE